MLARASTHRRRFLVRFVPHRSVFAGSRVLPDGTRLVLETRATGAVPLVDQSQPPRIAFAIVLLPWLLWRIRVVRRAAPLAVVQILIGVLLGPSCLERLAPGLHAALFTRPVLAALDGIAGFGVLLYVFVTGLHLDTARRGENGGHLGAIALGSVGVPLLLGADAGWWMLHAVPGALGPLGDRGPLSWRLASAAPSPPCRCWQR